MNAGGSEPHGTWTVQACAAEVRELLLRLESVQRDVGSIQSALVRLLGALDLPNANAGGAPAVSAGAIPPSLVGGTAAVMSSSTAAALSSAGSDATNPDVVLSDGRGRVAVELSDAVARVLDPVEDERPRPCLDPLAWLAQRRVTVKRRPEPTPLEGAFDELALYLGDRFATIQPFYEAVKRRVAGSPYPRSVDLTSYPAQTRADITTFGRMLHANGFLTQYHYHKNTRSVVFDPQPDGRVTNFFTGGWLERYVLLTVVRHAEQRLPQSLHPVTCAQITVELPDQHVTELDILLGLPDQVLWLECKTSDWQDHARKFDRVARHLNVPLEHAGLVLLDPLSDSQKKAASALSRMTVLNPHELETFITNAILGEGKSLLTDGKGASLTPAPAPSKAVEPRVSKESGEVCETPVVASLRSRYTAWLSRHGLRPLEPDLRRRILADMLQYQQGQLTPLNELTRGLRARYSAAGESVSMSQLSDVGAALRRSGACVRQRHENYPDGVFLLEPQQDIDAVWQQMLRLYVWTLLKSPEWTSSTQLSAEDVAGVLVLPPVDDPEGWLDRVLAELEPSGRVMRSGAGWVAIGDYFVNLEPVSGDANTVDSKTVAAITVASPVTSPGGVVAVDPSVQEDALPPDAVEFPVARAASPGVVEGE